MASPESFPHLVVKPIFRAASGTRHGGTPLRQLFDSGHPRARVELRRTTTMIKRRTQRLALGLPVAILATMAMALPTRGAARSAIGAGDYCAELRLSDDATKASASTECLPFAVTAATETVGGGGTSPQPLPAVQEAIAAAANGPVLPLAIIAILLLLAGLLRLFCRAGVANADGSPFRRPPDSRRATAARLESASAAGSAAPRRTSSSALRCRARCKR